MKSENIPIYKKYIEKLSESFNSSYALLDPNFIKNIREESNWEKHIFYQNKEKINHETLDIKKYKNEIENIKKIGKGK